MENGTMLSRADSRTSEISFEVAANEVSVLDGYCQANGIKRTVVMRELLKEWSAKRLHEATLIMRVVGGDQIERK